LDEVDRSGISLGEMKKLLLVLAILLFTVLICEYHGYQRGYADGEKQTNTWWIDKKSTYYDIREVVRKRSENRYDHI
jgi:hypothetical protein